MDYHVVEFISSLLVILLTTCIKHINSIEASPLLINSSQQTEIESRFYKANNGSSSLHQNQAGTYSFAGYRKSFYGEIVGVHAKLSVWSPYVVAGDWSATLISIGEASRGFISELNAGWMVNPNMFHDMHPKIFASYRIVGQSNWCYSSYNSNSDEFVVSAFFPITNTSVYGGDPIFLHVSIMKNRRTKNWHLEVTIYNVLYKVGYWRASAISGFNDLEKKRLKWGGKVYRSSSSSNPVPMTGSGKTPQQGFGQASLISDMGYIDSDYSMKTLGRLWYRFCKAEVTDDTLYRVRAMYTPTIHTAFLYGGPKDKLE